MDVGATRLDPDFAQDGNRGIAHALIFFVGQGQRWGDRDGVAGMNAHGVDVFDRANDDAIVRFVANHFHLIFFPAQDAFFDQHFADRACRDATGANALKFVDIIGDATASATQGEAGADDGR